MRASAHEKRNEFMLEEYMGAVCVCITRKDYTGILFARLS